MPRRRITPTPHAEIPATDKLAVIYVRVSTEEQAQKGFSLPEQLDACRRRAVALGFPAERTVECLDEGVPGDVLQRPGLDRARELVRQGGVGVFLCLDPDRFSRDLLNQLLVDRELQKASVRVEFINFAYDKSPVGQAFFAFRGIMSQLEKAMIRERTMRGKLGKAKRGGLTHFPRTYGYAYNPEQGQMIEDRALADPAQPALGSRADIVRRMYQWAAAGDGPHAVARRLNDLGVPAPGGGEWMRATARRILRNETYTGTLYLHRYDAGGVKHNRYHPPDERARVHLRPQQDWIPVQVPALVDPELWARAQQQQDAARRRRPGFAKRVYLLSGLVRCGLCGSTVVGDLATNGKGRRYAWYRCTGRNARRCELPHLRAEPLEESVWARVKEWVLDPDTLFEDADAQTEVQASVRQEMEATAASLRSLTEAQTRILRLVAKGLVTDDQAETELAEIRSSQARLQLRQTELGAQLAAAPSDGRRQAVETLALELRNNLDQLTDEQRRDVIREFVVEVTVDRPPEMVIRARVR